MRFKNPSRGEIEIDEAAAQRARAAGIFTVMDRCLYRDRGWLSVSSPHAD